MNCNRPHEGAKSPFVFSSNMLAHQLATEAGFASVWVGDLVADERTCLSLGQIQQIEAAQRSGRRLVCLAFHQGDPGISQIFELFRASRLDPAWLEIAIFRADRIQPFVYGELARVLDGQAIGRGPGAIQPQTRIERLEKLVFRLACEIESMKTGRDLPEGVHRLGDVLGEVGI